VDAGHTPHAVWSANGSSGRDVWFISSSSVCTWLVYPLINVYIWCSLWHYVSGWFTEYLVPSLEIQSLWLPLADGILAYRCGCFVWVSRYLLKCGWLFFPLIVWRLIL
jgi:hypothetical protein